MASVQRLVEIIQEIAKGNYSNDIMALTRPDQPEPVRTIAEAMGMMMVKVETREYHLERLIDELKALNEQLKKNTIKVVSAMANALAARDRKAEPPDSRRMVMDLICDKQDKALVVKIKGSMDAVTAPDFDKECAGWIDGGESALVFDLAELEYISSAGLRSILMAAKKLKAVKGRIAFSSPSKMVEKVLSISGFSSLFPICGSLDDALNRL